MILVYGTYPRYSPEGCAAAFCPFCRDLRGFTIESISRIGHLFFIPIPIETEFVGHLFKCADCGATQFFGNLPVTRISQNYGTDVVRLAIETNPDLREDYEERLGLEEEIQSGNLPHDNDKRWELLFEPFNALSFEMEKGCAGTSGICRAAHSG